MGKIVNRETGEIDFVDDVPPTIPGVGEDPYSLGGAASAPQDLTPTPADNTSYTDATPPNFRASENASMADLNNQQQGPPMPDTTATTARDSNTADTTGSTGGNSGQTGSGSNTSSSGFRSEAGSRDESYTSPGSSGSGSSSGGTGTGTSMSRTVAGMQNAINASTVMQGQGYNHSKYASAKKNPLNQYISFNCLYTLACLTPQQQKDANFSSSGLKNIVCRTQGDWTKDNHVATEFGSYDYIIDDLVIATLPSMSKAAGAAFATKITFKVTEPYSLGLFFLALQEGATKSGYSNFREASYLLMVEFSGYREDKKPYKDNSLTRYIPIKFVTIKLRASQAGSIYECEAIPYNEVAFRDPFTTIKETTQLSGGTVDELLKSLLTALQRQVNNVKSDKTIDNPDTIELIFPSKFTSKINDGNAISKSTVYTNFDSAGQPPFPSQDARFDKVKQIYKDLQINTEKKRNFNYNAGTKIQDIISEVILRSQFVVTQLLEGASKTDPLGMIDWYRVETRVEDGPESKALGRQSRKMIFRIVPYKVSISRLIPPNTQPPSYEGLNASTTRVYEYLYTGQNTDILKLDLEFNMAFYAAIPADATNTTGTANSGLTTNAGGKNEIETFNMSNKVPSSNASDETGSSAPSGNPNAVVSNPKGGSGSDDGKSIQSRTLEALLTNEGDLANLEIEVRGDPYYLPSSGMGNIIRKEADGAAGFNEMEDGAMNYQSGETDFVVVIRTPIDIDPKTGLYKFAKTVDELSGLFMITEVESKFNHNRFTQIVRGIRRRVQLGSGSGSKNTFFS